MNFDPRIAVALQTLADRAGAAGDTPTASTCRAALAGNIPALIRALAILGEAYAQVEPKHRNDTINVTSDGEVTDDAGAVWVPAGNAEVIIKRAAKVHGAQHVARAIVTIAPTMGTWHS
jgi:hypothetical protein